MYFYGFFQTDVSIKGTNIDADLKISLHVHVCIKNILKISYSYS